MSDDAEQPTEYSLRMPFTVVSSVGGPFDDEAFVAGYECGLIDAELAVTTKDELRFTVHVENVPQLDLIGMKHGFSVGRDWISDSNGWTIAVFQRPEVGK